MSTEIVHELPANIWDSFVFQHPLGNIFHTREMFEVWSRTKGYQPELWVMMKKNRIVALMLPVHISLWDGWLWHLTTRSIVFGDILAAPSSRPDDTASLLQAYRLRNKHSLFTELRHGSDADPQHLILSQCEFRYADHCNYLVNLAMPVEKVWQGIGRSTRKNIRKAMNKNEFVIEEVKERAQLPQWYALMLKTFEHVSVPLADISLFYAAFDILQPCGMAQFLLGRVNSTYVAASVSLLYKGVVFGWYRGFDRDYSKYIPNDLMVWHLLEWGSHNGYHTFNFGGAGDPNEQYGPRNFKAKFGGTLVSFGRSTCVHHPLLLAFSKMGYAALRKFL